MSSKDEHISENEATKESGGDMDTANVSSGSADSTQKENQNELESPYSNQLSSIGSKEGNGESTNLPQTSGDDDDGKNTGNAGVSSLGDSIEYGPLTLIPVGRSASTHLNLHPGIQSLITPAHQNLENPEPKQRHEEVPANPSVKLPCSVTPVRPSQQATPSKTPINKVADILAKRGVTMIRSGGKNLPGATNMSRVPLAEGGVSQLNSSVSITPSGRSQQHPYASRELPTVNSTSDADHPTPHHAMQQSAHHTQQQAQHMRNRAYTERTPPHGCPPVRVSCHFCDNVFNSQGALNKHLPSHGRIRNKLPFECKECTVQYRTEQRLAAHKRKFHKTSSAASHMVPVVDFRETAVVHRFASLGMRNFIPLVQLHNQQNIEQFCVPIVSVELANNPVFYNLSGIGASNLLPIGPVENIPT